MTPCTTVRQGISTLLKKSNELLKYHSTYQPQICDANFSLYMPIKIIRTVVSNKISIQGWSYIAQRLVERSLDMDKALG